jgi:hypothetical protein
LAFPFISYRPWDTLSIITLHQKVFPNAIPF